MDNCKYNIEYPKDKYTKYFLLQDYFHDSKINSIRFCNSKGKNDYSPDQIVLRIKSIVDIDKDWDKIKGIDTEKKFYINENTDKYSYDLYFIDCKYFNCEKSVFANDYIKGRFKNSAILQKIIKSTNKKYYHFRITTDDGYIDLIFRNFKIKKVVGRIYTKDIDIEDYSIKVLNNYNDGYLLMENGELNIEKLLGIIENEEDFYIYFALNYLISHTDEVIIKYARYILMLDREEYEMSRSIAIMIIGLQGNEEDLSVLLEEYFNLEKTLTDISICYCSILSEKREIMDAIENINYRKNNGYNLII